MRCDHPMGYDEDYLEPAHELFLQLFLQNAQIAVNDESSHDSEGAPNADFVGFESDDDFSFPSLHTISDGSGSSASSMYGDEGQDQIVDAVTSHLVENTSENSLLENDESCRLINNTVEVQKIVNENSDSHSEIYESTSIVHSFTIQDISNDSIHESSSPLHSPHIQDISNDSIHESSPLVHSPHMQDISDDSIHESSSIAHSPYIQDMSDDSIHESSPVVHTPIYEEASNVTWPDSPECGTIPSNELSSSNESSFYQEISVQTDVFSHGISSITSTHVSVYVIVPSDPYSSLSNTSSDTLPEYIPRNSSSPSLVISGGENAVLEHESLCTVNKICDNSEEIASNSSAICSSLSVSEDNPKHQPLDSNSVSDIKNNDSIENTVGFDENSHPESMTFDAPLAEEMSIHKDGNINCAAVSDKSVPNLKRKVVSSVDDDVMNKVPKYSLSHESSESVNEVSFNNYCKEFSSDTERATISEEDNINILPSTANAENVILPSQKSVEENKVAEQ